MDDIPSSKRFDQYEFTSPETLTKKSDTGKPSVVFENTSTKPELTQKRTEYPEEVRNVEEETVRPTERKHQKKERPTSAVCSWNKGLSERCARTRPRSSPEKLSLEDRGERGCTSPGLSEEGPGALWDYFGFPSHIHRKCRSSCDFSRAVHSNYENMPGSERVFYKLQRSLRLLGFAPSDFGVLSRRTETTPKWRPKRLTPTFRTKISCRSISLDSLRESVRQAWLDDTFDESHRRLLSQAVYEEWYFTKEREIQERRGEERLKRLKTKLKLREDYQRKKEKSEEEFQKWIRRKKTKKRKERTLLQKKEKPFTRLKDSVEKSEKAFLNWKKAKDKDMQLLKMQKRKEEEKKKESEKQKAERKLIAEKAFQQWKKKLAENERKKEAKREIKKRKQEMEESRRRAAETRISFQMWKKAKDEQIKRAIQQYKEAAKTEREERNAQMEERMYEAEQAFEEWLEKVDLRKQKQFTYYKTVPWIPA